MSAPDLTPDELSRYARHLVLPDFGVEGQLRLRDARVACVGAGGLGSPLLLYLAAAGVGTLGIVDDDEVDASNLQRQVLYGTADVGRPKLERAEARLLDVNPHVEVVRHDARLTSENALEILDGWDVVVDGTDNFPTRYLVNDACVLLGVPNVYGSVFRWEGQVSVFGAPGGPCYRCLFREPPPPGLVPSCAEGGVLGVLPGIIGSLQAMETLKLLLGTGEPLVGRLLLFDALRMAWREVALRRNPDCPVCGDEPTQTGLIDYEAFCGLSAPAAEGSAAAAGAAGQGVEEIDAATLDARLAGPSPPLLVDVREPWEWSAGNLEARGALHVPLDRLDEALPALQARLAERADGDAPPAVVFCCRSGTRSRTAAGKLVDARTGADPVRVANLAGGLKGWSRDVDPTLTVV